MDASDLGDYLLKLFLSLNPIIVAGGLLEQSSVLLRVSQATVLQRASFQCLLQSEADLEVRS